MSKSKITIDDVEEYCKARMLKIVTAEMFNKMTEMYDLGVRYIALTEKLDYFATDIAEKTGCDKNLILTIFKKYNLC